MCSRKPRVNNQNSYYDHSHVVESDTNMATIDKKHDPHLVREAEDI